MNKVFLPLISILFISLAFNSVKAKKRVIFFGDSITEAGLQSKGYISVLKHMLDSTGKSSKYELIGAGVSGNKVGDLKRRLQKDVLSQHPDLVVIYIGINDVWHFHHECCKNKGGGTPKADFEKELKEIISKIKAAGAKVILCTPSVIGEKVPGDNELDNQLDSYADISRKVAKESFVSLLDLRKLFQDYIKENIGQNTSTGILTTDGVHMNDSGNKFIANKMYPVITSVKF